MKNDMKEIYSGTERDQILRNIIRGAVPEIKEATEYNRDGHILTQYHRVLGRLYKFVWDNPRKPLQFFQITGSTLEEFNSRFPEN